jgi:hypothetical protein
MFGFGRPSNEKAVINLFALQFEGLGLPEREAVDTATQLVDEVLADIRPRGIDPFKTTQGNEYVSRESFIGPRLAAGLKSEDVRSYWNRPLLVILCESKMRELANFLVVDLARQKGEDPGVAGDHYKRNFPRYGDPLRWDPSSKFNVGLRKVDADLYPEFSARVDTWRRGVSDAEVTRLIEQHGTLNAVIRNVLSEGVL